MLLEINDIDLFFIGSIVMMLLFGGLFVVVILSQQKKLKYQHGLQQLKEEQQNQLIESAVKSEEMERHRIAEQLHDEVGAILSATKLHVANIQTGNLSEKDIGLHIKSKELLDEAIKKVRTISHNLHSSILKEFGLNEAIRHFVKNTAGNLIDTTIELDDNYLSKDTEGDMSTYRLIQELVQNILKHARPTSLTIIEKFDGQVLKFSFFHNGHGMTQAGFESMRFSTDGLGLRTIQNRLILLKATIEFGKQQAGYFIYLSIPKSK